MWAKDGTKAGGQLTMAKASQSPSDLSAFPIFGQLGDVAQQRLAAATTTRNWQSGSLLFQRGDEEDHLIALVSGRVRLSLASPQGRELVLRHAGPGEVLGELALIDGLARSADAVAIQPTTALILRRDRFLTIAAEHSDVGLAVARYLCGQLRNTNFQMESIALYDLQIRLVRFILLTLQQIYGADIPDTASLTLGLNQTDLSAVLGASRPKVNHALQSLISIGGIRRDGDKLICDTGILQDQIDANDFD